MAEAAEWRVHVRQQILDVIERESGSPPAVDAAERVHPPPGLG